MEPAVLIVTALNAGAATTLGGTATPAAADAYARLKALLTAAFANEPAAAAALANPKKELGAAFGPLMDEVLRSGAHEDQDILQAAQRLVDLIGPAATTDTGRHAATGLDESEAAGDYGIHYEGSSRQPDRDDAPTRRAAAEPDEAEAAGDYGIHYEGSSRQPSRDDAPTRRAAAEPDEAEAAGDYGIHYEGSSRQPDRDDAPE